MRAAVVAALAGTLLVIGFLGLRGLPGGTTSPTGNPTPSSTWPLSVELVPQSPPADQAAPSESSP